MDPNDIDNSDELVQKSHEIMAKIIKNLGIAIYENVGSY